ncbi:MAG: hypothetical protein U9N54_06245 [candidate division Zixibacteria bacterium]|nr:hypothetical protein [candidate division Zixibacteria bacterium]
MGKEINKDIFGRFVVGGIVAFLMFHYNVEIIQLLESGNNYLLSLDKSFMANLGRTFDDAGILLAFVLLIVIFIYTIFKIVILLIAWAIVSILGFLNDIYVLPLLIPLLIVYSKFSYSFIAIPILWVPKKVLLLMRKFGRFLYKLFNLLVVVPIAEVIALKESPKKQFYKIITSLLFVFGLCGIVIGGTGVAVKIIQDGSFVGGVQSFVKNNLPDVFSEDIYTNIKRQAVLQASIPNWTKTSIQLKRGDVVTFTATGKIKCISPFKGGMSVTNPMGLYLFNGYVVPDALTKSYRRKGFYPNNYILPGENINCLMAKVGNGGAFFVGSNKSYKVEHDGVLFLGINQVWKSGAWKKNSGYFDINMIVRRKV